MALKDHLRRPLPLPAPTPNERQLLQRRQAVAVLAACWPREVAARLLWLRYLYERGRLCE